MTALEQDTRTLFERLVALVDHEGFVFERHDDARAVRIPYRGTDTEWSCIAQVWEEARVFACYSVSPLRATENLDAAGAFVNLANIGVLVGNFEIDRSDGEIRFKTSVGFGPSEWSDDVARVVLYTNLEAMDHYALSLLRVVTGAASPAEAIGGIE